MYSVQLYQKSGKHGAVPKFGRVWVGACRDKEKKRLIWMGVWRLVTLDSKGRQADRQQAYGYMCGVIGMLTMVCQYHRSRGSWHVSSHTNMRQVNNPR